MENLKRIEKCLREVRKISGEIKARSFVLQDLLFESIDVVDLLFSVEKEFKKVMTMLEFNAYVVDQVERRKDSTWDFTVEELDRYIQMGE